MAINFVVLPRPAPPATLPKAAPFPHRYEVRLEARDFGSALLAPPRARIVGGAPPEFGGSDQWWSPEHLLLASLNLCLRATFEALARLKHLDVRGYASTAHGVLDRSPNGPVFTSFSIAVELTIDAADAERACVLLEKAEQHCIVANALKVPVELRIAVHG